MPSSSNTACFRHLKGNCSCKDVLNINIGKQLRTPKGGDKKRWRDFAVMLYQGEYFKKILDDLKILTFLGITEKMLSGRGTYLNYREHRASVRRINRAKRTDLNSVDYWKRKMERISKSIQEAPEYYNNPNLSSWVKADVKDYKDNEKRKKAGRKHI